MNLYLIRHGQSYINLKEWENGNEDTPLTDLGQRQAKALATWMPANIPPFDHLYASTMVRARETAQHVSGAYANQEILWDDRIREIGNNRHDHTPWPAADLPNYGEKWGTEVPFTSITPSVEGGESWMHFRTRIGSFIEEIAEKHVDESVVAVCHGGVIGAIVDHAFNVGSWRRCEVWNHNTSITYFEYIRHPGREVWRLHFQNKHEHLINVE